MWCAPLRRSTLEPSAWPGPSPGKPREELNGNWRPMPVPRPAPMVQCPAGRNKVPPPDSHMSDSKLAETTHMLPLHRAINTRSEQSPRAEKAKRELIALPFSPFLVLLCRRAVRTVVGLRGGGILLLLSVAPSAATATVATGSFLVLRESTAIVPPSSGLVRGAAMGRRILQRRKAVLCPGKVFLLLSSIRNDFVSVGRKEILLRLLQRVLAQMTSP